MNPEQIAQTEAAIAEKCGWGMFSTCDIGLGPTLIADIWPGQEAMGPREVPHYLSDLNACAEMEGTLTDEERATYLGVLQDMFWFSPHLPTPAILATSLQRAEAFCRVKGIEWPKQCGLREG